MGSPPSPFGWGKWPPVLPLYVSPKQHPGEQGSSLPCCLDSPVSWREMDEPHELGFTVISGKVVAAVSCTLLLVACATTRHL